MVVSFVNFSALRRLDSKAYEGIVIEAGRALTTHKYEIQTKQHERN